MAVYREQGNLRRAGQGRREPGSVAATAAAANAAAAEAGFAGEIGVFSHRGLQRIQTFSHDRAGEVSPFEGFYPGERVRTTTKRQARSCGNDKED